MIAAAITLVLVGAGLLAVALVGGSLGALYGSSAASVAALLAVGAAIIQHRRRSAGTPRGTA